MPPTIEILKRRYPEVCLIVAFQTGLLMIFNQFSSLAVAAESAGPKVGIISPRLAFLLGLGTMAIAIISEMLRLGFLQTACTQGADPQEPATLVKVGRYFFWRSLRFQIIISLVSIGLAYAVIAILAPSFVDPDKVEQIPKWLETIATLAASLAVIKFMAMLLPMMIARDMMVLQAFSALKKYRLTDAPRLVAIYIASFVIMAAISFVSTRPQLDTTTRYLIIAFQGIFISFAFLVIYLEALRFIGANEQSAPQQQQTDNEWIVK